MKKLLLLLVVLLCLNQISALEIAEEYDTNIIVRDLSNSIELELTITNATEGVYNVYTLADISLQPSQVFIIDKDPFVKKFTIKPNDNLDILGHYSFSYTLNHRGVEKYNQKFLINLVNLEDIIEIGSDFIDQESGEVEFYIQNLEEVNLKNLSAKFSSILFETKETFDLGPKEKRKFTIEVDENELKKIKAGVYIIKSVFETENGERRIDGNLYLGERKGITTTEDKAGFLIRTETITKINSGNVLENVQVELKRNIISRLFTDFETEPTIVDRKGFTIEYTWIKQNLGPTDVYIVKAKTNYILPFLIIIVAVLALIGFKRFSETKVEVTKAVSPVKTKNGEFALKVKLALKATKNVENVTLIDKVPRIVKIYKKFGTVKPDKIDAASRRIHWHIGDLNPGEERIFSYIVYSKVGVVGKFSLPEALAVFEKEGKIHEVESNKVFFLNEQITGN